MTGMCKTFEIFFFGNHAKISGGNQKVRSLEQFVQRLQKFLQNIPDPLRKVTKYQIMKQMFYLFKNMQDVQVERVTDLF